MDNEKKVLIICSNCLYSKKMDRHKSDPSKTKFILMDSCYKCAVDSLDGIRYFTKNMDNIK